MSNVKSKLISLLNTKIINVRRDFCKKSTGSIDYFMKGINLIADAHESKYKIRKDNTYVDMINYLKELNLGDAIFDYYEDPFSFDNQKGIVTAFNVLADNVERSRLKNTNNEDKENSLDMLLAYHSIANLDVVNVITNWQLDPNLDAEQILADCQPKG